MSRKNITDVDTVKGTITFKAADGLRQYKFSKPTLKKILVDGRDPAEFKGTEITKKKEDSM